MEADVTERLGRARTNGCPIASASATATASACSTAGSGHSSRPSPSYAPARTSRLAAAAEAGAERALVAVIQEAYVKGISTRKVDDLVRAMGASGISKSEVSRLVSELDVDLAAFRDRRLDGPAPVPVARRPIREGPRRRDIVNAAFLVAIAANERGEREVLGCAVASAESEILDELPALARGPGPDRCAARHQ